MGFARYLFLLLAPAAMWAAPASSRYALILADKPVVRQFARGGAWRTAAAEQYRARLAAEQADLRRQVTQRGFTVTGSAQRLLNAVFVAAPASRVGELRGLPGVAAVVPLRRFRMQLNAAVNVVNAPAAWQLLGGVGSAGAGIKIAILDSGIDQTHPAFQDAALGVPAGFPKCTGGDCAFTNNKVIVARSYVPMLAAGTQPNPAQDSRPDDPSPRDRVGHGTALAMVSAGETNTGPAATITGMAPKAWLGNYKIFGSPGINDFTSGDVIISALEQAVSDGMDIAVLSLGSPAFTGPLDQGTVCGNGAGQPCDPQAAAVENAVAAGITVVVAAGNDGDLGQVFSPALGTIDSPGTTPAAISVGAITNSHQWFNAVRVNGSAVPSNLQQIPAAFGDGPIPPQPVTAPVRDVTATGDNGFTCTALPPGSMTGAFALIRRDPSGGTCTFLQKEQNAQNAGAVGVIFYQNSVTQDFVTPGGLTNTDIPAVLVDYTSGIALKSYVDANPNTTATLDPGFVPQPAQAGQVTDWSSHGPTIGTGAIKPELTAVGTDLYMATQSYDPNGEMYDPSGYTVANGTSFATPMVAGGVALVKQKNPGYTPGQLKSAVVNTANPRATKSDGSAALPPDTGAGYLDAGAAVSSNVTVEPATLSFGFLGPNQQALPQNISLKITNTGTGSENLALLFSQQTPDAVTRLSLSASTLALGAGQSQTVTVTLAGSTPTPGIYTGILAVQGGSVSLRVPYMYVVGDGVPADIYPLSGDGGDCTVGQDIADGFVVFRVVDQYGVGVPGVAAKFSATQGGGQLKNPDASTDANGLAGAEAVCGPTPGSQVFTGSAGKSLSVTFTDTARNQPVISQGGAVNAASYDVGKGLAPGSYVSLFGANLSPDSKPAHAARLPIAIDQVSVGFDAGSISLPGALAYVSPGQINVQIPWELQGQSSAQIKVDIEDSLGQLYTLPLATYSPGIFVLNGNAAAINVDNGGIVSASNPATRGHYVSLYVNGLGPVSNTPPDGQPAPLNTLSSTTSLPAVSIGGQAATVQFSGLAPGYSGLYQVNVLVPATAPTGNQQVVVSIGGVSSKPATLPVQ